jgi:hypothetical protein
MMIILHLEFIFSNPSQSSTKIMDVFPQICASHFSVLPAFGKQNPISM